MFPVCCWRWWGCVVACWKWSLLSFSLSLISYHLYCTYTENVVWSEINLRATVVPVKWWNLMHLYMHRLMKGCNSKRRSSTLVGMSARLVYGCNLIVQRGRSFKKSSEKFPQCLRGYWGLCCAVRCSFKCSINCLASASLWRELVQVSTHIYITLIFLGITRACVTSKCLPHWL